MKFLLKLLQYIYCIYAYTLFVLLMLVIFPAVLIATLFGRIKGGNSIIWLCRGWAGSWFPLVGIIHKKIYESPHDPTRSYIFVSNHISYLDAAVIVKAYQQSFRPLAKAEMTKVPIFGIIYKYATVTVDRSNAENRARSIEILKSLIKKGISVLVFPEGTFNMGTTPLKDFYDGAFRVAIETQTPIKPVLFLDTYRRMNYKTIFSLTPGINRLLYLEEIPVKDYSSNDIALLKEKVFKVMEKKMLEYHGGWRKEH